MAQISKLLSLSACILFLAACFLVSDREIGIRIVTAMPSALSLELDEVHKTVECIAAKFSFSNNDTALTNSNETKSGLGETWNEAESFYSYNEGSDNEHRKSKNAATVLFSKPCMKKIGVDYHFLYDTPVFVSSSRSGSELLIIYSNSASGSGIYLAH